MSERAGRDDAVERLRSALDELTAHVDADPPELRVGDMNGRVIARGNDRGVVTDRKPGWRPVTAAAAAVIVAAAGTVMLRGGGDEGSLGTAEPTATLPPASAPVSPANDTDHSWLPLAAVPEGWDVIEWGDVRMAVPGEWRLTDDAAGCDSVRVGTSADTLTVGCAGVTVTIWPDADDTAEPTGMINGIPVADLGGDGCIGCPEFISSPVWGGQVGIGVDDAGTDLRMTAEQIRDAITVSARWRAANEPPTPVPTTGWVETRHLGVTLTVPSSWAVREARPGESDPDGCGRAGLRERTVFLERGVFDDDDCPPFAPLLPAVDGVRIYSCDQQGPSNRPPLGPTLGDPKIWILDDERCVVVRVGIGTDPTTGLAVLGSLRGIDAHQTPTAPRESPGTTVADTAAPSVPEPTNVPVEAEPICSGDLDVRDTAERFSDAMVTARASGAFVAVSDCLDQIPDAYTGQVPACWRICGNADRLIDPRLANYNEVGDAAGNWSWYTTLPVTYVVADGPPIDAIESWRIITDNDGHRIEDFSVDIPIVEREASLTVIDEYIAHVANGDWRAVAALLDDGAINLDERRDLAELDLDDYNLDTIAAALEQWCATGCDTQPPTAEELTFTGLYGIKRGDRRIEAQWFEGAYSISGLPIPLDHDQQD